MDQITEQERRRIAELVAEGAPAWKLHQEIGRSRYAVRRAVRLMRRPKPARLAVCPRLREAVEGKLELRWSPQQIAAWLRLAYPDDPEMRVSRETLYLSLFVQ